MLGHFLLVDLQQRAYLSVVVGICLTRIPGDDVAQLGSVEELLLVVHLNILRHEHSCLYLDTAFKGVALGIELAQVALEHIALLGIVSLSLVVMAVARSIHINLFVDNLVLNGYVVIVNSILLAKLNAEFGCQGNVELEHVGCRTFEVNGLLALVGKGLSQHGKLVVGNVLLQAVAQQLVDGIHLHRCAEHTLHLAHGHLARTEARNVGTLAVRLQVLLYIGLIVGLLYGDGHQAVHLVLGLE